MACTDRLSHNFIKLKNVISQGMLVTTPTSLAGVDCDTTVDNNVVCCTFQPQNDDIIYSD